MAAQKAALATVLATVLATLLPTLLDTRPETLPATGPDLQPVRRAGPVGPRAIAFAFNLTSANSRANSQTNSQTIWVRSIAACLDRPASML
jgi:hypothetical protein